ncbi:GNAT family N-acetyltransferase [Desulfoluna spongiiphila]|uniref:GNAT family N-acetyltransferase n=1 Tax=Desulfoluna spongiiphila TaxID=419481 RepID=UPI000B84DA13|nr:GNAT family N-acetyltransferase [Desulfoluna spongiiphila]
MITFSERNLEHFDSISLVNELSEILSRITGDSGKSSFNEYEFEQNGGKFIVAYENDNAIACGSIRQFDEESCEIKRMYSRKSGLGKQVLKELENQAKLLKYTKLMLSTRRVNLKAVNFYMRNGFIEIPPYGKYKSRKESICLAKILPNIQ